MFSQPVCAYLEVFRESEEFQVNTYKNQALGSNVISRNWTRMGHVLRRRSVRKCGEWLGKSRERRQSEWSKWWTFLNPVWVWGPRARSTSLPALRCLNTHDRIGVSVLHSTIWPNAECTLILEVHMFNCNSIQCICLVPTSVLTQRTCISGRRPNPRHSACTLCRRPFPVPSTSRWGMRRRCPVWCRNDARETCCLCMRCRAGRQTRWASRRYTSARGHTDCRRFAVEGNKEKVWRAARSAHRVRATYDWISVAELTS